jgi:hypothetical protein
VAGTREAKPNMEEFKAAVAKGKIRYGHKETGQDRPCSTESIAMQRTRIPSTDEGEHEPGLLGRNRLLNLGLLALTAFWDLLPTVVSKIEVPQVADSGDNGLCEKENTGTTDNEIVRLNTPNCQAPGPSRSQSCLFE